MDNMGKEKILAENTTSIFPIMRLPLELRSRIYQEIPMKFIGAGRLVCKDWQATIDKHYIYGYRYIDIKWNPYWKHCLVQRLSGTCIHLPTNLPGGIAHDGCGGLFRGLYGRCSIKYPQLLKQLTLSPVIDDDANEEIHRSASEESWKGVQECRSLFTSLEELVLYLDFRETLAVPLASSYLCSFLEFLAHCHQTVRKLYIVIFFDPIQPISQSVQLLDSDIARINFKVVSKLDKIRDFKLVTTIDQLGFPIWFQVLSQQKCLVSLDLEIPLREIISWLEQLEIIIPNNRHSIRKLKIKIGHISRTKGSRQLLNDLQIDLKVLGCTTRLQELELNLVCGCESSLHNYCHDRATIIVSNFKYIPASIKNIYVTSFHGDRDDLYQFCSSSEKLKNIEMLRISSCEIEFKRNNWLLAVYEKLLSLEQSIIVEYSIDSNYLRAKKKGP